MRLFLALWPDDAVRRQLVSAQRAWLWPARTAPVPADRLHLTLHFLGEVAEDGARELASSLPPCKAPFTLRLDRAALWPQGIAVLEPSDAPAGLATLHADLAALLRAQGLRVEARAFRPHVTLARHAQGAMPPAELPAIEWAVRGYALVRSRAGASAGYEPIARA
ncbi:MAG: RNA 2',3'-cyclic phosphodiesterase [Piscinibacter sp.]|uniref:RNA 2',3'-cyclic phosphodiesterase n=1 Tax=Piscinibacter sp. TaxID=1903157 RepID=UPI003D0E759E